jgi:uncharacterized protein (DUF58 family)
MKTLLRALTTRGRAFVAAGVIAGACGLLIPEPDLLRIGLLLIILPLLSAFGSGRARYRLSCTRRAEPARVQVGQPTELTMRLSNVSRLRTGLLLAQDTLPRPLRYQPGGAPRFVLDGLRGGGERSVRYQVRPDTRGKYTIGPLQVRVADSFGLVSVMRSFTSVSTLTVTPRIVALPRPPLGGNWLGDSDDGRRSIAAGGEDDVVPRAYQTGDGLRRVHWRSTARYGELMVRREEQHWRNTATLFVDTRRSVFPASGSFELAVTVAASVGVHLAGTGVDARLVTDAGEIPAQAVFQDTLLDMLAVIRPSRSPTLAPGLGALGSTGGQIIGVFGMLSAEQATQVAAARRGTAPALALVIGGASGSSGGSNGHGPWAGATVLTAAGWRVAMVPDERSLAAAWGELHRGRAAGAAGMTRELIDD